MADEKTRTHILRELRSLEERQANPSDNAGKGCTRTTKVSVLLLWSFSYI